MTNTEISSLRSKLEKDLWREESGEREKVRRLVKEFLMDEASLIAADRRHPLRNLEAINELILLNSRVVLLRTLIENPKAIPTREVRELLKDTEAEKKRGALPEGPVDPMALVGSLDISDEKKADIVKAMADAIAAKMEPRRIGRGK